MLAYCVRKTATWRRREQQHSTACSRRRPVAVCMSCTMAWVHQLLMFFCGQHVHINLPLDVCSSILESHRKFKFGENVCWYTLLHV